MSGWISPRRIIGWGRWALGLGVLAALGTFLIVPVRVVVPATGIVKAASVTVAAPYELQVASILAPSDGLVSKGDPVIVADTAPVLEKMAELKSSVNSLRSSLKIEDIKLELRALEKRLADSVVYAPVSGVVEFGELEPGRVVYPARFLFRIQPTDLRLVEIKAPEDGYEAFAPESAVTLTDSRGRRHAGTVVFRGERVRGTRYPYVLCHATCDTGIDLPLGSRLTVEAVHYRGPLLRCLFLTGRPGSGVFRFGS